MAAAACGCYAIGSRLGLFEGAEQKEATERWRRRIEESDYVVPSRASQVSKLRETSPSSPLDLLIIGGGATGCGCALDASTRGLKVGLVERDDFSSGTSSRSTKLVHGGKLLRSLSSLYMVLIHETAWF
jgi:glycerol-3-phosphate dehydrogenase